MVSTPSTNYIETNSKTYSESFLPSPADERYELASSLYTPEKGATSLVKLTKNGICAFLAVSAPTYAPSIIEDKSSETIIDPALFINDALSIHEQKLEVPIKANNPEEVQDFLTNHPELIEPLDSLSNKIPSDFVGSARIEYYKDIEEHWEKLFVLIDTEIESFEEVEHIENALYKKLIEPLGKPIREKIVLTVS